MAETATFAAGGYRFIPAAFQFSSGVAASSGFELERVRLARPVALAEGFAAIESHLAAIGRPTASLARCELRSPAPLTDAGFGEFNRAYVATLERWGLVRDGTNPVARTNVCPRYDPPAAPALYAFCYTVPAGDGSRATFALAGAGEARPGPGPYSERIARFGDTSPEGLREKVLVVIAEIERRLGLLGFDWSSTLVTQAYTVYDIGPLVGELLARRGALAGGLVWHYARPPVIGLDFELDAHTVAREWVL